MTINPIKTNSEPIKIFDTTLRDGEQSPGASMTQAEKVEIADLLDAMGVSIIEAGFPIASPGDHAAVKEIAGRIQNAEVCALARAADDDIRSAGDAIQAARRGRIHTFISTSPVHMTYKLKMEPGEVLEAIDRSVHLARQYTDNVQWSPEDATRSERSFLRTCVETAIEAGATTINIPDTVGYAVPGEYEDLIRDLIKSVPGARNVTFSVHCHDDLGLAVANSLAGVEAGARQIECAINGIGERAGNAALEEAVMAIRTRSDYFPFHTTVRTEMLMRASKMISAVTSFPVPYNKAIVGRNAFSHEAGIHQDGMLKHHQTYEIMKPEQVGVHQTSLVMGKHSGRHAFRVKLKELGFELGESAFEDAFSRLKRLADRKKQIFDEDIEALVESEIARKNERIRVAELRVIAGTHGAQRAELKLVVDDQEMSTSATGNGPVDAIFNAITELVPHNLRLDLYQVHAVTEGTDAQAEVSVRVSDSDGGLVASARQADPDTLVASAMAYVTALNRMRAKQERFSHAGRQPLSTSVSGESTPYPS